MFFTPSDDDDGSDFTVGVAAPGAKLSSLFDMGQPSPEQGNDSLIYKAPKQPKGKVGDAKDEGNPAADPKSQPPALLFACACHAFKCVSGQYVTQGKLGCALLGNHTSREYNLLLYGAQKKTVATSKIHHAFSFVVQQNNYAMFYDDQSQTWSLNFDTEAGLADMAKWIALSKYNMSSKVLVMQDANYVEGQEVQKGDTVEVLYTGWLHSAGAVGKVFDSNRESGKPLKFKVGKGKLIPGWDAGLVGMKKGGKRVLVIPPELAYGSKGLVNRVPPNSSLIFEVEITRVKFVNSQSIPDVKGNPAPQPLAKSSSSSVASDISVVDQSMDPLDDEPGSEPRARANTGESLKSRSESISTKLTQAPENSKAKLLERMSKMGQSIIPNQQLKSRTLSEQEATTTEEELKQQTPVFERKESVDATFHTESPKPVLKPKPELHHQHTAAAPVAAAPSMDQSSRPHVEPERVPRQSPDPAMRTDLLHGASGAYFNPPLYPPSYMQPPVTQSLNQLALYQQPSAMFGMPPLAQVMAAPTVSSTEVNLIMTDGRMRHVELKNDVVRLTEKVDSMMGKLEKLYEERTQLVSANRQPEISLETGTLLHNITRIVKENEKFRVECEEKSKKIEMLNERMSDLLARNQSFFERSNQLLVEQTGSMHSNASQAMEKVAKLELQNAQLSADLLKAQSKVVHLEKALESSGLSCNEALSQLQQLQAEHKATKEKFEASSSSSIEHEQALFSVREKLNEEKQQKKEMRNRIEEMADELNELRMEKETLEKSVAELKQRRKEDQKKFDREAEEMKASHEEEMESLRQRFKKTAGSEAEKLTKLEGELSAKFEERLRHQMEDANKKHSEQMAELSRENETLVNKLKSADRKLHDKVDLMKAEREEEVKRHEELAAEARKMYEHSVRELKRTHAEDLENQGKQYSAQLQVEKEAEYSRGLKDGASRGERSSSSHFDKGVAHGKSEAERLFMARLEVEKRAEFERGVAEGRSLAAASQQARDAVGQDGSQAVDVAGEVKKIMNGVFFKLRGQFELSEQYEGKAVISVILNTIKEVTLGMIKGSESKVSPTGGDTDDSDSDEEISEASEETESDDSVEEEEADEVGSSVSAGRDEPVTAITSTEVAEEPSSANSPVVAPEAFVAVEEPSVNNASGHPTAFENSTDGLVVSPAPASVTDEPLSRADAHSPANADRGPVVRDPLGAALTNSNRAANAEMQDAPTAQSEALFVASLLPPVYADEDSTEKLPSDDTDSGSIDKVAPVPSSKSIEAESANALADVGLDPSLFANDSATIDAVVVPVVPVQSPGAALEDRRAPSVEEGEHSLFFANVESEQESLDKSKSDETAAKSTGKPAVKASDPIFGDLSDEDDLFSPKSKPGKTTSSSPFVRSPPPLFEDDDGDTNWI